MKRRSFLQMVGIAPLAKAFNWDMLQYKPDPEKIKKELEQAGISEKESWSLPYPKIYLNSRRLECIIAGIEIRGQLCVIDVTRMGEDHKEYIKPLRQHPDVEIIFRKHPKHGMEFRNQINETLLHHEPAQFKIEMDAQTAFEYQAFIQEIEDHNELGEYSLKTVLSITGAVNVL